MKTTITSMGVALSLAITSHAALPSTFPASATPPTAESRAPPSTRSSIYESTFQTIRPADALRAHIASCGTGPPVGWAVQGSFKGLRARGDFTVDCAWKNGKVTAFHIRSAKPASARVRINGELRDIKTEPLTNL